MTISSTTNRVTYTGNNVTTAFAVSFPFHAQADLVVVETIIATGVQTTKALTTHYTISGTTDALGHYSSGGTVNALVAPAATVRWSIYRDPARTQGLDLTENNNLPAESVEAAIDYQTMLIQRVADLIGRSLRQPDGDSSSVGELPSSVARASLFLAFDTNGDPVAASAFSSNPGSTPVSAYMATVLDDLTAPDARLTLGIPDIAAKGDLIVGTANDTIDALTVGSTTGHVLTVDPSASAGLSWGHRAQPNPIINGNMDVWQRGTTFAAVANFAYTADRWKWTKGGSAGVVTISKSTNVPSVGSAGILFSASLEVDVTTADAVISGDTYTVLQSIEGYNWKHFAQRPFTLSFWVSSSKTGVHCISFRNSGADRYYIAEYTVSVADTWEYKAITVLASPSAGSWDYASGIGLQIDWVLASSSTAAAGSWATGASYATVNQVNVMDSTANFFRLTGVKMELGSVATPIQYVPFEEELARCQRYYQKSFPYATAPAQNAGNVGADLLYAPFTGTTQVNIPITFQTRMRTAPGTVVTYNPGAANAEARNTTDAADDNTTGVATTERGLFIAFAPNAANTVSDIHRVHWTADAEL